MRIKRCKATFVNSTIKTRKTQHKLLWIATGVVIITQPTVMSFTEEQAPNEMIIYNEHCQNLNFQNKLTIIQDKNRLSRSGC